MKLKFNIIPGILLMCAGGTAQAQATYSDLHDFGGTVKNANGTQGLDATGSESPVIFDSQGNMYGTTSLGGPNNIYGGFTTGEGVLWEITKAGTYIDLHDFGGKITSSTGQPCTDGVNIRGGIVIDSAGNIYGTAYGGGDGPNSGGGTNLYGGIVWEYTKAGVYKDLHDFGGTITTASGVSGSDGYAPTAAPTLDSSGNLYGTTSLGGGTANNEVGMVWEITNTGKYLDLHDFGGNTLDASGFTAPDGSLPYAPVTLDKSGNLYGSTYYGGPKGSGGGILWEITSAAPRIYKDLHDFGESITSATGASITDGYNPYYSVTLDPSGNMYCTTQLGGANGQGIVCELTTAHKYIDFYDFGGTTTTSAGNSVQDGQEPRAGVLFDSSGNMFGTTYNGGQFSAGMVWEITKAGKEVDLHDFFTYEGTTNGNNYYDGYLPWGVALDAAGNVYGTTYGGGPTGKDAGNIWAVGVGLLTSVTVTPTSVVGPAPTTGTVTISVAAPLDGTVVQLSANDGCGVPKTVTIPYGSTTATFPVTTVAVTTTTNATITASLGSTRVNCNLSIVGLESMALSTASVTGGGTITGTVSLTGPAPAGGVSVNLAVSSNYAKLAASSISIAAGSTVSNSFSITTTPVTSSTPVTVTASLGAASVPQTFTILPPTVASVIVADGLYVGGNSGTGTVTLNGNVLAATVVPLTVTAVDGSVSSLQLPASATVQAGQSSGTFNFTTSGVNVETVEKITAQLGSVGQSTTFEIVGLKSVFTFPATVIGGQNAELYLSPTSTLPKNIGWVVALTATSTTSPLPISMASTAPISYYSDPTFIRTSPVTANATVQITATWGGSKLTTTLNILAPTLTNVTLSPTTVQGSSSTAVTGTLTLSGPVLKSTPISLKSSMPSVVTVSPTATVNQNGSTATFTVTHVKVTKTQTVGITATFNGVSRTVKLTVTP